MAYTSKTERHFIELLGKRREVRIIRSGAKTSDVVVVGDVDTKRFFKVRNSEIGHETLGRPDIRERIADTAAKLRERIAVRAYFLWENDNYPAATDEQRWLAAERLELSLIEARAARAKKAAATRKANAEAKAPIAAVAKRAPSTRRAAVH